MIRAMLSSSTLNLLLQFPSYHLIIFQELQTRTSLLSGHQLTYTGSISWVHRLHSPSLVSSISMQCSGAAAVWLSSFDQPDRTVDVHAGTEKAESSDLEGCL